MEDLFGWVMILAAPPQLALYQDLAPGTRSLTSLPSALVAMDEHTRAHSDPIPVSIQGGLALLPPHSLLTEGMSIPAALLPLWEAANVATSS